MLTQQTLEKLNWMRLTVMAKEFRRQSEELHNTQLTFDERFGMLVDSEWTARQNKHLERLFLKAGMRQHSCLEDLDYSYDRGLKRETIQQLSTCAWIRDGHNLLVTGPAGTGKSYVACALGNCACRQQLMVRYHRVNRLLTDLAIARGDGSYNKTMKELKKTQLLILDDWGMAPLDATAGRDLLEVIEDRCQERSTVIVSQLPVAKWHPLFADVTVGDAVLDRLIHDAHRIHLAGESMRLLRSRKGGAQDDMTE
jgi:DNA replication protein DnaC